MTSFTGSGKAARQQKLETFDYNVGGRRVTAYEAQRAEAVDNRKGVGNTRGVTSPTEFEPEAHSNILDRNGGDDHTRQVVSCSETNI